MRCDPSLPYYHTFSGSKLERCQIVESPSFGARFSRRGKCRAKLILVQVNSEEEPCGRLVARSESAQGIHTSASGCSGKSLLGGDQGIPISETLKAEAVCTIARYGLDLHAINVTGWVVKERELVST